MDDSELLDSELLARFISHGSADAMGELVRRNLDLVYSAARRQSPDEATAQDVTQAVFMLLSRKARTIRGPVAGWLVRAAWYAAKNASKLDARRRFHERQAAKMRPEITQEPAWEDYSGELDSALASLNDRDRSAIVLRYFRGMTLREVGDSLRINEEAARKRIDRTMIRLRQIMRREVAVPSVAGLTTALAARGTEAAPTQVAQSIAAGSATGAAATIAAQTATAMTWAGAKIAAAIVITVAVVGAGVGATAVELLEKPGNNASKPAATNSAATNLTATNPPAFAPITTQNQRLLTTLSKRIAAAQLPKITLARAFTFVTDITAIRINPDWNSLQTIGVDRTSPVHIAASDVYLYHLLDQLIRQAGNGTAIWSISNGTIRVSAPPVANVLSTRAYDLGVLVIDRPRTDSIPNLLIDKSPVTKAREIAKEDKTRQIAKDIVTHVAPDSWKDGREIGVFDRWLLVSQTSDAHMQIENYLAQLRCGPGARIRIDADILGLSGKSIQRDFIEKISTGPVTNVGAAEGRNISNLPEILKYRQNFVMDSMSFLIGDGQSSWAIGDSESSALGIEKAAVDHDRKQVSFDLSLQRRDDDHNETIDGKKQLVALYSTLTEKLTLTDGEYLLIRIPAGKWVELIEPGGSNAVPNTQPTEVTISAMFQKLHQPDIYLLITQRVEQ